MRRWFAPGRSPAAGRKAWPHIYRLTALFLFAPLLIAQTDWPVYGHDPGGLRYSPLTQITPGNVAKLERVWTFHSGQPGSEATPLVIAGVMYVTV
ncbi:MAG TPA: hypothetical protein VHB50_02105, partial [Bryobacteraceae bacterium]|nr:hypothetical protein [Bryobacteraceae bacterium]